MRMPLILVAIFTDRGLSDAAQCVPIAGSYSCYGVGRIFTVISGLRNNGKTQWQADYIMRCFLPRPNPSAVWH
ncbi:hypothetical protein NP590_20035, partial [Methylomonas sp. SURF-2]